MNNYGEKGITIIALVVTIITLLILAAVTIGMTIGSNGLFLRSQEASLQYKNSTTNEMEQLNDATDSIDQIIKKNTTEEKKEILAVEKLKVGDFIDYSAGNWSQEEIDAMGDLYSGPSMPTISEPFKFGGFKVGESKEKTKTPGYGHGNNLYTTGWRVLSIEEDGTIKITTAGTTEGYYHPSDVNYAYKTEYIFTGNKNDKDTSTITEGVNVRNWSMYETGNNAIKNSAHCITYEEAFQITENKGANETVRKTGSWYWLSSANTSNNMKCVYNQRKYKL